MPLYEYLCSDCRRPCELLIRGEEQPLCPHCGSRQLAKQFSVIAAPGHHGASVSAPSPGGCGLPECGTGRCAYGS